MKLRIQFCVELDFQQEGIKLNNLLYQLRKFMKEIFFSLLREIFLALEEAEIQRLKEKEPGRFVRNGRQGHARKIRTSYGVFSFAFARLFDKKEKRTCMPLLSVLGLPKWGRGSLEALEGATGLVCHLSFRKSVQEVQRILGTEVSKNTLWRAVQRFSQKSCERKSFKNVPYRFLMVDGTKVRIQGEEKKSEMRVALASLGEKKKFEVIGCWVDTSWKHIRKDLEEMLDYAQIEVLFSDGAPGIEENLLAKGMRHQRCVWHGKREFSIMLYFDKARKRERAQLEKKIKEIPVFLLKQEKLEKIDPKDIPKVSELFRKTQRGFRELLKSLPKKKYPHAHSYIQNLAKKVNTFFEFWLEKGEWIPIHTHAIESMFSQVKNRIWNIGRRWSEKGLLNWMKMTIQKVFYPASFEELWKQYLGVNDKLKISIGEVRYEWV